ncbi:MAG: hypothetical protein Q9210_002525 [Variospora velana]
MTVTYYGISTLENATHVDTDPTASSMEAWFDAERPTETTNVRVAEEVLEFMDPSKDVQTNYGPVFIAKSGERDKIILLMQGICLLLTRWFSAADYDKAMPSPGASLEQKSRLRAVIKIERVLLHGGHGIEDEEDVGNSVDEKADAVSAKFRGVIKEVLTPVVSPIVSMDAFEKGLS